MTDPRQPEPEPFPPELDGSSQRGPLGLPADAASDPHIDRGTVIGHAVKSMGRWGWSLIGIMLATMLEKRVRELLVLREALDRKWVTGGKGGACSWATNLSPEASALLNALPVGPPSTIPFCSEGAATFDTSTPNDASSSSLYSTR